MNQADDNGSFDGNKNVSSHGDKTGVAADVEESAASASR